MPSGVPIATPSKVMMRLPAIAFKRPPDDPGGGVIWVKTDGDRPPNPWMMSSSKNDDEPAQAESGRGVA